MGAPLGRDDGGTGKGPHGRARGRSGPPSPQAVPELGRGSDPAAKDHHASGDDRRGRISTLGANSTRRRGSTVARRGPTAVSRTTMSTGRSARYGTTFFPSLPAAATTRTPPPRPRGSPARPAHRRGPALLDRQRWRPRRGSDRSRRPPVRRRSPHLGRYHCCGARVRRGRRAGQPEHQSAAASPCLMRSRRASRGG